MGAIWFRRIELVTSLNELVGFKAGLSLDREKMAELLQDEAEVVIGEDNEMLRVRSEAYEDLLAKLLHGVGNIASPDSIPSHIKLYHRVKNDTQLYPIYLSVAEEWVAFLGREMGKCQKSNSKLIDPRPLLAWAEKKHGLEGQAIALALLEGQNADMHKVPWGNFRRIEWSDVTELTQLFTSERLTTKHGTFFDQRFIDYLAQNQTEVGQINWRKFEGLTCEFFQCSGFKVEIGKGRNDDSIDARIWKPNQDERTDAPLMLVQCKRQKDHVEKVVVKALYADVIHAGAESGLIVTSSSLSPGAKKLCVARSYPIKAVESDTLSKWLSEMRTPFSGIFMGE